MTGSTASSQTAERSLDREVMTLDLPAILGGMKQEPTWRTAKRNAMTLVKQPVFRVVLVALRAGAEIGSHETEGPITMHVIEGHMEVRVNDEVIVLGPGQVLIFRSRLRHAMRAHDDSAFLLTLTAEDPHPAEHPV